MSGLLGYLAKQPKVNHFLASLLLVTLIGLVNYQTGRELSFSLFYLVPVFLTTWFIGRGAAALMIVITTGFWAFSDFLAEPFYRHPAAPYWNLFMRIGVFWAFAYLLLRLKHELGKEALLSRTDPLTGVANARAFSEIAQRELERTRRYDGVTTISYFDLDNFKTVNDTYGHHVGDKLLRTVATTLQSNTRSVDTVTRIGGDEFVVLMPETDHVHAQSAIYKLRSRLSRAMEGNRWPVTFSVGVLTFKTPPESVATMIQQVDRLMYRVKNSSKDGVLFDYEA